ncbi:MAG: type I glyceraldehyde-3-phosphate dehydrogenase [Candidatus Pacebacteria bacterium]|jgi:glyceraldehyde 3-phosphate dehydrogenase|nr:type I glyceraldehyde-3-phosphate dehydrogenase [Candidatus Paceibacterota bacterium]
MKKIAINGLGRIGRHVFKLLLDKHQDVELVAVNDLTEPKAIAHLIRFDSIYGRYDREIEVTEKEIIIQGKKAPKRIAIFAEADPANLPWKKLGVDVVLECTGRFTKYDDAAKHLIAGAKKVVISAPSKDSDKVPSYLLGINADQYDPAKTDVMDMGSCTTNCLAPVAKILNDTFGIEKGFMTTVHAYTNDQKILDVAHKDLRRARSAGTNIIPTSTGAAKTIGKVIPELKGKLDGIALRVPVSTVSVVDLFCVLGRETSALEVNEALEKATLKKPLKGIMAFEKLPLVSTDFIGSTYSSIVDAGLTMANGNVAKVVAWYDNEWGYSTRLAEFAEYVAEKQ